MQPLRPSLILSGGGVPAEPRLFGLSAAAAGAQGPAAARDEGAGWRHGQLHCHFLGRWPAGVRILLVFAKTQ